MTARARWGALVLGLTLAWPAAAGAALDGRVVTPDGRPVEGARVEAVGEVTVVTGRRGEFSLPGVEAPAGLLVTHPRFVDGVIDLPRAPASDEPFEIVLQPRQEVFETVVVSATGDTWGDGGGPVQPVSVAASTVTPGGEPAPPSTVVDLLDSVPGVAEEGAGGHYQAFAIRGVAGQRVQVRLAGAPLVTERRVGVSASWIDPMLVDSLDVLRGPSSSVYGPGALGGLVQLFPRRFDGWAVSSGYASAGDESFQSAGWGDGTWSLGFAHRRADAAEAPDGTPLHSGFTQWSATVARRWRTDGGLDVELLAIPSRAEDVGRPDSRFPQVTVTHPEENHLLARASVRRPGEWRLDLHVHPNDLSTEERTRQTVSLVERESLDLGANGQRELDLPWNLAGRVGLDLLLRRGVEGTETLRQIGGGGGPGPVPEISTILDGSEDQAGVYASVRRPVGRSTVEAGGRFSAIRQGHAGFDRRDDDAWSGFLGLTVPLGGGFELAGNVATGERFPTLTELYFSGATGRGRAIANPDLDPERSLSTDLGLRFYGRRLYSSVHVFSNQIDDYIERVQVAPGVRSFENLTSGTLQGAELDGFFQWSDALRLDWGGQWLDGEDDADGSELADVPADRVHLRLRWRRGRVTVATRLQHRVSKSETGPGEVPLEAADLLSAGLTVRLLPGLDLTLSGENLFDETYLPAADMLVTPAPGRSLGLAVRWAR